MRDVEYSLDNYKGFVNYKLLVSVSIFSVAQTESETKTITRYLTHVFGMRLFNEEIN